MSEIDRLRQARADFFNSATGQQTLNAWRVGSGIPPITDKQKRYLETLRSVLSDYAREYGWDEVAVWLIDNPIPADVAAASKQIDRVLRATKMSSRFSGEQIVRRILSA